MICKSMRKPNIKALNKKLDIEWSKAVKERAGYKCEVCGATSVLNSHHVIGRVNKALRWDLRNGVCLCVKHHEFGMQSAHQDPQWFMNWFMMTRNDDYMYLQASKYIISKKTIEEKQELLEKLKEYGK